MLEYYFPRLKWSLLAEAMKFYPLDCARSLTNGDNIENINLFTEIYLIERKWLIADKHICC